MSVNLLGSHASGDFGGRLNFHLDSEAIDLDVIAPSLSALQYPYSHEEATQGIDCNYAGDNPQDFQIFYDDENCGPEVVCQITEEVVTSSADEADFSTDTPKINLTACEVCGNPTEMPSLEHARDQFFCPNCLKNQKSNISTSVAYHDFEADESEAEEEKASLMCEICRRFYSNLADLNEHKRNHTIPANNSIHCPICFMRFATSGQLQEHQISHVEEKPFSCKFCFESYATTKELNSHAEQHTENLRFKCKFCMEKFASNSLRTKHVNKMHVVGLRVDEIILASSTEDQKNPFQCKFCDKKFASSEKLTHHQSVHSGEKPFTCPVCLKNFRLNAYLKRHMQLHTRMRDYICEFCGKGFLFSNNLAEHRRIHTGERPYRCEHCSLSFAQISTLHRHKVVHTGEREHQCQICRKKFSRPNQLTIHLRTHSGEKPFQCKVCFKSFNQSGQMTRHSKIHHADRFRSSVVSPDMAAGAAVFGSSEEIPKWDLYLPRVISLDSPLLSSESGL